MLQVILMWNLTRPNDELDELVKKIELRGDNPAIYLTGQFASKIAIKLELNSERESGTISAEEFEEEVLKNGAIDPLSVSLIADKYCPTRRDLYLAKGINCQKAKSCKTWGSAAGYLVEQSIFEGMSQDCDEENYSYIIAKANELKQAFAEAKKKKISELTKTEGKDGDSKIGDTSWFLKLLDYNGRAELAFNILKSKLKDNGAIDLENVQTKLEICPNIAEIGINAPAAPDFIIPEARIVGDIKTGANFASHHQLTCAGYALAYENQNKGAKIDWGIVYFFPTRNPTAYVKPITFAQVYIFPIDDALRRWFRQTRDAAYNTISKQTIPDFPDNGNRTHCLSCKYRDFCTENGLEVN